MASWLTAPMARSFSGIWNNCQHYSKKSNLIAVLTSSTLQAFSQFYSFDNFATFFLWLHRCCQVSPWKCVAVVLIMIEIKFKVLNLFRFRLKFFKKFSEFFESFRHQVLQLPYLAFILFIAVFHHQHVTTFHSQAFVRRSVIKLLSFLLERPFL